MIVGGTFSEDGGKPSGVVQQLAEKLDLPMINGGTITELRQHTELRGKLVFWMPNVSNDTEKVYPKKARGSVLICSKVLRSNRTLADAITRIFMMHGNAVIAIRSDARPFSFQLVDALGNTWTTTTDLDELADGIRRFVDWNRGVQRVSSSNAGPAVELSREEVQTLRALCQINTTLADRVEASTADAITGRRFLWQSVYALREALSEPEDRSAGFCITKEC